MPACAIPGPTRRSTRATSGAESSATGGGVRLDMGNERAGLYVSGDGAALTGYHVLENRKYEGTMGAYFRVKNWPEYGSLNIGASFFGMHYEYNERGMTYGQGGYFSPNVYFLAGVPVPSTATTRRTSTTPSMAVSAFRRFRKTRRPTIRWISSCRRVQAMPSIPRTAIRA